MVEALGSMRHRVDLLTYHLGTNPEMENVRIHRIPRLPIKSVPTAFSMQKLILDIPLSTKFLGMAVSNRYDVIHCVEESIFIALFTQRLHGLPCIFDIDSSMPDQLARKNKMLQQFHPFFSSMERWAIRKSLCCVTVCTTLSDNVRRAAPKKKVFQIEDVPLVPDDMMSEEEATGKRKELGIANEKVCAYVGNFSRYQGIDLMFRSFKKVIGKIRNAKLLIIGGSQHEVDEQKRKADELGILHNTTFTGRKPPDESARLLGLADVLLSPRTEGTNTPMKIYTYMASGVPIVATKLLTHTQVLSEGSAVLVAPQPQEMAHGIIKLMEDHDLGRELAAKAARIVEENYSRERYLEKLREAYGWIESRIT